jgi:hypothetical protein
VVLIQYFLLHFLKVPISVSYYFILTDAGPCMGDSGGGFYVKQRTSEALDFWVLTGVVSTSASKIIGNYCNDIKYAAFVDVQKQIAWIRNNTSYQNPRKFKF